MRRAYFLPTIAVLSAAMTTLTAATLVAAPATRQAKVSADRVAHLAARAVESQGAEAAITELRAMGPSGLNALFKAHRMAIEEATVSQVPLDGERLERWERIRNAIDGVSGQRDCSGLYWYTDFDAAQVAAKLAGKPILSLHMLGKLTDEFSCANSRFFRSTLYTNQEVAKLLREQFVLHWQTVRPVPIVTIDFGDGRTLRRTVTGNSAHYVLTPDGQPIDAIPGLYGPQAFIRLLNNAGALAHAVMSADSSSGRAGLIAEYHRRRSELLDRAWQRDMAQLSKAKSAITVAASSPAEASEDTWNRVALLHASSAQLDDASRRLIESQHPTAVATMEVAVTKAAVERPLARLVRNLQSSIALDTVRNEYLLHRRIHDWFAAGSIGELQAFNERVYAELFQTPSSDPWLGLLPQGYTALENNGVVAANP